MGIKKNALFFHLRRRKAVRMARPDLHTVTDAAVFRNHYYLLSELKDYCRSKRLPVSGGKLDLTDRIALFMDTGEMERPKPKAPITHRTGPITQDSIIEENIRCSELHRAFFNASIGKHFSFTVAFQQWLKENVGRSYREAIDAYAGIKANPKTRQTVISKQFEYNTYIRAFFEENHGTSLQDAIACWRYKKGQPGHNRYEKKDLNAIAGGDDTNV